ncbi:metal ABC transporter solute-binding protein, Zn/Mn family [Virgibacillus kimchii]
MKFVQVTFILILISLFISGCSSQEASSDSNENSKLEIYTSVYPIQYAVKEIAGDTAAVETVFSPGTDAHTYEPTSQDIISIAESDAFIYMGSNMEAFSTSIADALESHDVKLMELGQYDELFSSSNHYANHDHSEEDSEPKVFIEGLSDHYHSGDSINLTARIQGKVEHDHLHWYVLNPDEEEWEVIDGETSDYLERETEMDGQQIKVVLYGDDHEVTAESEPVSIIIDDHEEDHHQGDDSHEHEDHHHGDDSQGEEENRTVELEGVSSHYHTGDSINLTAKLDETDAYDHLHWFTLNPNAEEWTVVDGETSNNFESEAEIDGQQIKAVFYDEDHEVVAESETVTIIIDDHDGDLNPHIWIDPLRMITAAEIIKDQLVEMNPSEKELYNKNFEALKERLTELDMNYTELLSDKENKSIIVAHAAFGYWEERYGINQIPISGLSSSDEPSQRQLTEIINQSKEHDLDYVLFEQNTSNRLAEVIQEEIGAQSLTLHNLEVLTQNDIDKEEDYFTLMERNLEVLDAATE